MAHRSEYINTKNHHLVDVVWPIIGSKGDKYSVTLTNYGFECNCAAYRKCKHIKGVEEGLLGTDELK